MGFLCQIVPKIGIYLRINFDEYRKIGTDFKNKRVYLSNESKKKQFNSKNYRMVRASIRQLLLTIFFARVVTFLSKKVLKSGDIQSSIEEI